MQIEPFAALYAPAARLSQTPQMRLRTLADAGHALNAAIGAAFDSPPPPDPEALDPQEGLRLWIARHLDALSALARESTPKVPTLFWSTPVRDLGPLSLHAEGRDPTVVVPLLPDAYSVLVARDPLNPIEHRRLSSAMRAALHRRGQLDEAAIIVGEFRRPGASEQPHRYAQAMNPAPSQEERMAEEAMWAALEARVETLSGLQPGRMTLLRALNQFQLALKPEGALHDALAECRPAVRELVHGRLRAGIAELSLELRKRDTVPVRHTLMRLQGLVQELRLRLMLRERLPGG